MEAAGCSYSIVLGLITLVVVVFVGREGVGVAICCFTEDFRQGGDCGHFSLDVAVHFARVGCEPDGTPGVTTSSSSWMRKASLLCQSMSRWIRFAELVLLAKCVQMLHRVQQFLGEQEGGVARAITYSLWQWASMITLMDLVFAAAQFAGSFPFPLKKTERDP